MIKLRNSAGAFLRRAGHFLLIKRSTDKEIAPGVWSCIGGHMEQGELNDPLECALREIEEETGITRGHVFGMELRYVLFRRSKDEIRQSYIYFGETDAADFTDTDEGTLHWIPEGELRDREYTKPFAVMLRHYTETPDEHRRVVVGTAGIRDERFHMSWAVAEEFDYTYA